MYLVTNYINVRYCIENFEDHSHSTISKNLGLNPTKIIERDEVLMLQNKWIIGLEYSTKGEFQDQFDAIITMLTPNIKQLKEYSERYDTYIVCAVCLTDPEESTPWVHLEQRHCDFLAKTGALFKLEFHYSELSD